MGKHGISTIWLLMAQHNGQAVVPLEEVALTHFGVTERRLLDQIYRREIVLPVTRMSDSQKARRGVHLADLAAYIDAQAEKARRETR